MLQKHSCDLFLYNIFISWYTFEYSTKEAGLEIHFKDLALKAGQCQGTVGDSEPGGGSFTPDSETADSNRLCDIIKYKIQIKPQKHIVYA